MSHPSDRRQQHRRSVDGVFISYYEDVHAWQNDELALNHNIDIIGANDLFYRTRRQSVVLDGQPYNMSRFFSLATTGSTQYYPQYDGHAICHLSGKYYESLALRYGFSLHHVNHATQYNLKQYADQLSPRYIFLSTSFMTTLMPIVDAVRQIRAAWPGVPVVLGGLFLVELEQTLSSERFRHVLHALNADLYLVTPLGESGFLKLMNSNPADLSSLDFDSGWIKQGKQFRKSAGVDPGVNIDDYPVAWDQLDSSGLYHVVNMRTARSCAFSCAFCSFPVNQGALTLADPATLERELIALTRTGRVKSLIFVDDTFNVPMPRFKKLCKILQKYDFRWYSFFRCQYADAETISLMEDSGCRGVYLGIESIDNNVLRNMNKSATTKDYLQGIRLLKRSKIFCHTSFVIGFPGDVEANTRQLVEFVDGEGIDFYSTAPWFYGENTPVHKKAAEYNLKGGSTVWSHNTMNSEEAHELDEWARTAPTDCVFVSELTSRTFWSEVQLVENGCSVSDAKKLMHTFNSFTNRDMSRAELLEDENFRQAGKILHAADFATTPGPMSPRGSTIFDEKHFDNSVI